MGFQVDIRQKISSHLDTRLEHQQKASVTMQGHQEIVACFCNFLSVCRARHQPMLIQNAAVKLHGAQLNGWGFRAMSD